MTSQPLSEIEYLRRQIDQLQNELRMAQINLNDCQSNHLSTGSKFTSDNAYSALEEFISIFTKQYLGIAVGVCASLVFRFLDQIYASRFAKKHNIRQKNIMTAAFPTFVCFVQYLLRKRKRNSKLAALLSVVKNIAPTANNENAPTVDSSSQKTTSQISKPSLMSRFSSVDSDLDSVFNASHGQSKDSKQSKQRKRHTQSLGAKYRKNSHVSIAMASSPAPRTSK